MHEVVRASWEQNAITLITDGWSDTRSRSIHGITAYSRGQAYFISASDASEIGKTVEALFKEWSNVIKVVGPEKVIQLLTTREPANRTAGRLLEERYPHITLMQAFCFLSFCSVLTLGQGMHTRDMCMGHAQWVFGCHL